MITENPIQPQTQPEPQAPALRSGDLFGLPSKYWKAPFHYCRDASAVFDVHNHMILDVRGYGYLTGIGSLGLTDALACKIQDEVGEGLAKILNASWPNA
jgi:hypothetical protein